MRTHLASAIELPNRHGAFDSAYQAESKSKTFFKGLWQALTRKIVRHLPLRFHSPKIYYVSINGNNKYEGTNPDRPVRDPNKLQLKPGDSIRFRRGEILTCVNIDDILDNNKIFIESYGTGQNPVIRCTEKYIEIEGTSWF